MPEQAYLSDKPAVLHELRCPNCGHPSLLPVEPVFDLAFAAPLIPMKLSNLQQWLTRHRDEFPRRFRLVGSGPQSRKRRVVTASEIREIRARFVVILGENENKITNAGWRGLRKKRAQEQA